MTFIQFFNIFLEANAGKRQDYLTKIYGPKLEKWLYEIMQTFQDRKDIIYRIGITIDPNNKQIFNFNTEIDEKQKKQTVEVVADLIVQFVIEKVDPKNGPYSEWILKSLLTSLEDKKEYEVDYKDFSNIQEIFRWFSEDFYEVTMNISYFIKYKKLLAENGEPTDLNKVNGFDALHYSLRIISDDISQEKDKEAMKSAEKDAEKIYQSENYLILVPQTQEASCAYGRGTRWCTAATGSHNYFNTYNRQGPLYIIINKKTQDKYQFHFQSQQYMDSDDYQLDLEEFFNDNKEVKKPILDLAFKNKEFNFIADVDTAYLINILDEIPETERGKIIKENALVAVEYSKTDPKFVNSVQDTFIFDETNTDVVRIHTHQDWSDLAEDFIGNSRRREESDSAKAILDGEYMVNCDGDSSYDPEYFDWLDNNSFIALQEYIADNYDAVVSNINEAKDVIEENNDENIKDLLTHSMDDAYCSAQESEYYRIVIDAIEDSLGSIHNWAENGGLIFKWSHKAVYDILKEMETPVECKSFVSDLATHLSEQNQLTVPDFDRVYGSPTKENQGDIFNQRFINDIGR